mgnify:CR=1 FL=1
MALAIDGGAEIISIPVRSSISNCALVLAICKRIEQSSAISPSGDTFVS